ncbi:MAG: helix-turn-helix domain-containing protein [Christensenellaceae bacterium]|nr:helix-turn-helix domain-containing protein [Christensenellaceae bacterium]
MTADLAARLRDLRESHDLTPEALADRLGVHADTVAAWERGEEAPNADHLLTMASLYGVTVDSLLQRPLPGSDDIDPNNPLPNGSFFDHVRETQRSSFPYPVAVAFAYLVLGFVFNLWHPGWIIFLTIPLYYLPAAQRTPVRLLCNPVMITIIYLLLGCFCNLWHPGWLVFLLIPILNAAVNK